MGKKNLIMHWNFRIDLDVQALLDHSEGIFEHFMLQKIQHFDTFEKR